MQSKIKTVVGFICCFFKLIGRNWWYDGVDEWHPYKYRITPRTAWNVAKGIWFDKWNEK